MTCRYDSAGPWNGGRGCSGSFTPGARALGEHLTGRYGGSFQGYNCRPNTAAPSMLSVHGTGRAVDFFPPSKAVGDQVAALLVDNWERWGVQMVIWYRRDWTCSNGWTSYGGPNPHTDHIHLELTVPAGQSNTAATYGRRPMPADVRARLVASAQAEARVRPALEVTRPVTRGDDVADVQRAIGGPVTGRYGRGTEKRVKAFQAFFGIPVDGVVGQRTWATVLFITAARYLGY